MPSRDQLLDILDLARWAPSGDNTQPWRFEIAGDGHIVIHGHDTRGHVVYDYEGWPSQIAHGALIETLRLAATRHGFDAAWRLRPDSPELAPVYDLTLTPGPTLGEDPLVACIERRTVQRRPLRTTPLAPDARAALVEAVGSDCRLMFFDSFGRRLAVARLLWYNADLRLTCPEAYTVHRDVIEWGARFSKDRIPEQAVGVDPLTARLMRWVMQRWERVEFFNRYLLGTVAPRVQLDWIPALACAAHVLLLPARPLATIEDRVRAGIAMQRLWLTAERYGLQLQPEMTPVIFRWYARTGRRISKLQSIDEGAARLADRFEHLAGVGPDTPFAFFCRIGYGRPASSRSLRKPLDEL